MAKWKEFPSPEAIVRAALDRAANEADAKRLRRLGWLDVVEPALRHAAENIRSLASDPAEVEAIIKKAGGKHELG
jgi:hypothetical protein